MSLLNPDLSNLEIKIDSTLTRKSGEYVETGDGPSTTYIVYAICFALKANRNDIEFSYDAENNPTLAVTPYGLCMQTVDKIADSEIIAASIPFVCKTTGRKGLAIFTNVEKANSVATIEWDDANEGGEGGGT